jgi:hypothetical protein
MHKQFSGQDMSGRIPSFGLPSQPRIGIFLLSLRVIIIMAWFAGRGGNDSDPINLLGEFLATRARTPEFTRALVWVYELSMDPNNAELIGQYMPQLAGALRAIPFNTPRNALEIMDSHLMLHVIRNTILLDKENKNGLNHVFLNNQIELLSVEGGRAQIEVYVANPATSWPIAEDILKKLDECKEQRAVVFEERQRNQRLPPVTTSRGRTCSIL